MGDKVTDWCYNIARRYRNFQRKYNLVDASYDIELGPVRRSRYDDIDLGEMGKCSSKLNTPSNREFYVGEYQNPRVTEQSRKFCSNRIRTTKYTVYSFVPKFLLEQFRKAANCFFLLVSLLQVIPGVSPTGRFTTLIPLSIILALTAVKEIIEDISRLRQDKKLNEKKVQVLTRRGSDGCLEWSVTNWDKIKVGNIVQIGTQSRTELDGSGLSADIPADLLVLATSETETGTCTITTKNLDGETNLKNKFAVTYTHNLITGNNQLTNSQLNNVDGSTDCIDLENGSSLGLSSIADARIMVTCECPHKNMAAFKGQLKDNFGQSFLDVASTPTTEDSGVDGNGMNKPVSTHCEVVPLVLENLLLRECKLENTGWIVAVVVYTGPETKISLNSKPPPLKQSSLEKITNIQIYFIFAMMLIVAIICFTGALIWDHRNDKDTKLYVPHQDETSVTDSDILQNMLLYATFFILFNNLVPISLMFTVEIVKIIQAYFINCDSQMVFNLIHARARTSNLTDELGRIKHLFSDKTGTLTQNKMEFKRCFIRDTAFDTDQDLTKEFVKQCGLGDSDNQTYQSLHQYLLMMACCNSVTPNEKANAGFISSSPDEHALVLGAKSLGYTLKSRGKDGLSIDTPSGCVKLKEIHILPFDSKRKRMSLICEDISERAQSSSPKFKIFTKGADDTVKDKLTLQSANNFKSNSEPQIDEYAKQGLRTLVFASRDLTSDEVTTLSLILGKLSDPKTPPEEKLLLDRDYDDLVKQLESELNLVGCSAVEDKLQDGVPECIASLRSADINVWMLTGDKLETAYEIAHSCQLFSPDADKFKVHKLESKLGDNQESVLKEMDKIAHDVSKYSSHQHGLIFDGTILKSLEFSPKNEEIAKKVFNFTKQFKSVAACRLEPLQKADLVEMTQMSAKNDITLAIGDGANDVPMIQAAHVGVGIQGEEGLQAVLASDYSIAQFRFLKRLLLIHGAFSYQRVSKTILYSFYKNITLYFINFWYQFVCGFSGQSVFDKVTLSLYNICFTSLPLFSLGVLDRPVSEAQMLKHVYLYRTSQLSLKFNATVFWTWCLNALAHSFFVFIICLMTTKGDTVLPDAHAVGVLSFGEVIYTAVVIVVTLKLILVTHSFFVLSIVLIFLGGIVAWTVWFAFSSHVMIGDAYGFFQNLVPSAYFWFAIILATVVALYRDVVYKCLKIQFYPSLEDCVKKGISLKAYRRYGKNEPMINFTSIQQNGAEVDVNSHLNEEEAAFTRRFPNMKNNAA